MPALILNRIVWNFYNLLLVLSSYHCTWQLRIQDAVRHTLERQLSVSSGHPAGPQGQEWRESLKCQHTYEWMNEWVNDWLNEWVNDWMNDWMPEWMTEWISDWISDWMDERMNKWVNEWVIEWWVKLIWPKQIITNTRRWWLNALGQEIPVKIFKCCCHENHLD